MPELAVALAAEDAGDLTLQEWDLLRSQPTVLFEDASHPLIERLAAEGVSTGAAQDGIEVGGAGAIVVPPDSPRLLEAARAGSEVRVGVARGPDPLTAAHGARLARRAARSLGELALVMARLRGPDGCPWDHEQSHASLQVHLLEEAHEVLEVIDEGRVGADLEEELGDLLLQVVFHAQIASDDGRFDIDSVARRLVAKLVHRHPHVFGDTDVSGAADVVRNWESIKAQEKTARSGPFDGIPSGLPALMAAHKTQKRAAALGFDADEDRARTNAAEALAAGDVGETLFWVVALARARGVDAEGALRKATAEFTRSL
ncbi:MAG TPA: MazG family protein [Actinomycetota bacterium]|nr:MazG family protein [Actinomycetota bacterium]